MTGTAKATREDTRYRISSCVERAAGKRSMYFSTVELQYSMYVPEKIDWVSRVYRDGYTCFTRTATYATLNRFVRHNRCCCDS